MHSNWFDHQSRCVNITSENRLHSVNKAIPPCTIIPIGEKNPIWRPYITMTGWSILDSTIKTDYVNDNSVIREYISYNYTNPEETGNLLQISKKIQNSIGETLIKNTIFPYHFKNIANDEYGIYNLQQKHIVDEQIEVSTFLLKHNQMHLIDAVNYCYDEELGIVKSINKLHNSGALTDFKPAHSTNGKVIFDSRYQNIFNVNEFDTKGNILQIEEENVLLTSYSYGYNNFLPISIAINSKFDESVYTSFENNELNGWNKYSANQFSSKYYFTGSQSIFTNTQFGPGIERVVGQECQLHSGYCASVWVKGSKDSYIHIQANSYSNSARTYNNEETATDIELQKWRLLKVHLSKNRISDGDILKVYVGNLSSDESYFDELRFCPIDSKLTTYTYAPLIGITSFNDGSNSSRKYFYDKSGRLEIIKDFNDNIIKYIEYNINSNN